VIVVQPNEIPRGLTGKVLKRVLRERYEAMFAHPTPGALAATSS